LEHHSDDSKIDSKIRELRTSRRGFLKNVGVGAVGAAIGAPSLLGQSSTRAQRSWLLEADIVVVGTGAAGSSAALNAHRLGNSVVLVEKAATYGGTTAKSGGTHWIPNNSLMRAQGIQDSREDAMHYMVRVAFPHLYNPEDGYLGIAADQYEVIAAFYDNAGSALDALHSMTTLRSHFRSTRDGKPYMDARADLPENKLIIGRVLRSNRTGSQDEGTGFDLSSQLRRAVVQAGIPLLFQHRANGVLQNGKGEVTGLEVRKPEGDTAAIRARKAVIFCSGGFTHNREFRLGFLQGPVFGGCAVPTNEGDFVYIAAKLGAALANMNNAWLWPIVFEQTLDSSVTPSGLAVVPGESSVMVNRYGRRIVNEKLHHTDQTDVHFVWDAGRVEYPNLLTFMIYDQRTADGAAGTFPLPQRGHSASYVITGQTIKQLEAAIEARLEKWAGRTGNFRLDPDFGMELQKTIPRFNKFAKQGKDEEFHRGDSLFELAPYSSAERDKGNPTMFPISTKGPYYAIILAAGTLDTHGGPKINARAQIVDTNGKPIPGLYGAGNCIGFAGRGYWGGGGTIGPALTFGYIAAREASQEALKQIDAPAATD
jgi:3-oxosteroid 1-dehydrogenase